MRGIKRLFGLAVVIPFILAGCSHAEFVSVQTPEPEWQLETPDFSASLWEENGSGEVTILNHTTSPLGIPSLAWYNASTQVLDLIPIAEAASIPANQSVTKQIDFPQDFLPTSYLQLQLDGQAVGGFYAVSALPSTYPAWTFSTSPATQRPTSGIWSFEFSGPGTFSGTCSAISGGVPGQGQVDLEVATNGLTARLKAEGKNILFNRVSPEQAVYESLSETFSVEHQETTVIGSVEYDFTASAADQISGMLTWDNGLGCSGQYPFSMELISPAAWELFIPQEGFWTISYGAPGPCNGMEVNLGVLTGLPFGAGELTLNGGGAAPLQIQVDTPNGDFQVTQSGTGNSYVSTYPNQYMGTQFDPVTQHSVMFFGSAQMWGLSQTSLFGNLLMQGSNGCGVAVPFTLIRV